MVFLLLCLVFVANGQNFLNPDNMRSMAEIATELSSLAAKNVVQNQKDVQASAAVVEPPTLDDKIKPSQLFGQAIHSINSQSRNMVLEAIDKVTTANPTLSIPIPSVESTTPTFNLSPTFAPVSSSTIASIQQRQHLSSSHERDVLGVGSYNKKEIRLAQRAPVQPEQTIQSAQGGGNFENSPFMKIAKTFLQMPEGGSRADGSASMNNLGEQISKLGIRDVIPNADNNFGLPRGKGCLPFISEFMQAAYGNCQQEADEKTFDAWGDELRNAILNGQIDFLKASQETCRRTAEREQCDALREAVADCDVIRSLNIGTQLQRAMKRCEEVSGLIDQNPYVIMNQMSKLIGGEVAQGFFNNFLKNGK